MKGSRVGNGALEGVGAVSVRGEHPEYWISRWERM